VSDDPRAGTVRWLVVLRHAKSAWPDVPDVERPLGKRGHRDAPKVGAWLRDHGWAPDRVLCSPARRTRETWQLAASGLDTSPPVTYDRRIYGADTTLLLRTIADGAERAATVLLIGHWPGVQDLALWLAGDGSDEEALQRVRTKFPTSGIAVLAIPTGWTDLAPRVGRLTDFAVPRG
jgi:phosphohistidine phosphatase